MYSDSGLVDMAADILRKEMEWRGIHKTEEKKPSIRVQLAVPPAPVAAVGEPPKKYGREEVR